jgi:transcriptional regulator with XRE-family HTH domain
MTVSEKIKAFGLKKYPTLKDFADAIGVSYAHLYHYIKEDNPSLPGTPFLLQLRKLGCDMNWLLGDEEMTPYQEFLLKEIRQLTEERDKARSESKSKENKIVNAVRSTLEGYSKGKELEEEKKKNVYLLNEVNRLYKIAEKIEEYKSDKPTKKRREK